jgi:hypothetical protein
LAEPSKCWWRKHGERKPGERKHGERKPGERKPGERKHGERKHGERKPTLNIPRARMFRTSSPAPLHRSEIRRLLAAPQ